MKEQGDSDAQPMIIVLWFFWFIKILTFTIVLLNFLIAVISQSYEDTMMRSEQNQYIQKAHLNLETQIIADAFRNLIIFPALVLKKIEKSGKLVKFLTMFLLLIYLIPVIAVCFLIFGFSQVKEFYEEAKGIAIEDREGGYCMSLIGFQKSEDAEEDDEWMGVIRTLQYGIKDQLATNFKQISAKIDSKIDSS